MRYGWFLIAVCLLAAGLPAAVHAGNLDDTVFIIKDDATPSNSDVALAVLDETPFADVAEIVVSRDDNFADALASGVLQDEAPLILVPSDGPLPEAVRAAIADLAPGRATVLGGTAAIADAVVTELEGMGVEVRRRAGATRFDTAIEVAREDAADADTAILARAFPAPGSADATQAFADTLAAGGMSARTGFPILLTQSDVLTEVTRDHLLSADVTRVLLVGGTAAISEDVEAELRALGLQVERIAGESRAGTATQIAKELGDDTAADAARVVLTDGQGENAWAAGFALASHAARFDAPILLSLGETLPPETQEFLQTGIGGDQASPRITCAFRNAVCEDARVTAGLPPQPVDDELPPQELTFTDAEPVEVPIPTEPGDLITVAVTELTPAEGTDELCLRLDIVDALGGGLINATGCAVAGAGYLEIGPVAAVREGDHVARLTPQDGTTGSATLWINDVATGPAALQASTELTVDRPNDVIDRTFEGSAGQLVSVALGGFVPAEGTTETCWAFDVIDPVGQPLAVAGPACRGDGEGGFDSGARALARDGTYTIRARTTRTTTGSATLHVSLAEVADAALGGPAVELSLPRPGAVEQLEFDADLDQLLGVAVTDLVPTADADRGCVTVRLRAPDAAVLASDSACSDGAAEGLSLGPLRAPGDGRYGLEIVAAVDTAAAATVWLNGRAAAPITPDQAPLTVDLSRPDDVVEYTFDGVPGQVVSVAVRDMSPTGGAEMCLVTSIRGPGDGAAGLAGPACRGADGAFDTGPRVLGLAGPHTVRIRTTQQTTGTVQLFFNGASTSAVTVDGPAADVDLPRPADIIDHTFTRQAGQQVAVTVEMMSAEGGTDQLCLAADLLAPSGARIAMGGRCTTSGTTITIPATTTTESGTHRVRVYSTDDTTGSAQIRLTST